MFKKEYAEPLMSFLSPYQILTSLLNSIPPSNRSKVKSSVQRGLRQKLLETYPGFEPYIEEIMPKKASLEAVKLYVQAFFSPIQFQIPHHLPQPIQAKPAPIEPPIPAKQS